MYYILFYNTVSDYLEKRAEFREEHLRLAQKEFDSGNLIMAGAVADPADEALLIFNCNSPKIPENFAKNDPYVINGLIANWYVRPWTVVIGENQAGVSR